MVLTIFLDRFGGGAARYNDEGASKGFTVELLEVQSLHGVVMRSLLELAR
jgi:hypothetical protein